MNDTINNIRARLMNAVAPMLERLSARTESARARAYARYEKLEPRERLMLKVLALVFGVFFLYDFIYLPIADLNSGLTVKVEHRQHELGEVRGLTQLYLRREAELRLAEKHTLSSARNFSLFSAMESTLTKSVGRDKIGSITPRPDLKLPDGFIQHSVDLQLSDISLKQLVDALYSVGGLAEPVSVSSLRITRRNGDTHSYDVEMTCVAVARNG